MRAIFCGNLEYDARQSDVERLFKRYGRVDRVDMKSGITWNVHALYLDEWVHCISYLVCAQGSYFLCFSRRTNLVCHGTTILHFPVTLLLFHSS